jgi:hypothetical protein
LFLASFFACNQTLSTGIPRCNTEKNGGPEGPPVVSVSGNRMSMKTFYTIVLAVSTLKNGGLPGARYASIEPSAANV